MTNYFVSVVNFITEIFCDKISMTEGLFSTGVTFIDFDKMEFFGVHDTCTQVHNVIIEVFLQRE